jgi:hypothetical protein
MSAVRDPRFSRWSVAVGLYAVVSLLALAGLLLAPGTIGHHWDWLVPADPSELRRLASLEGSAWQDFAFGSYVTYRYATIFTSLLFGLPGYVGLGGAFVSKALVALSVFVSAVAMRFLLLAITGDERNDRDEVLATLAGLFYALAPYAYNQIVAGDQSAYISDALSPFVIAFAIKTIRARDRLWVAHALTASLLLAIIVASVQVFTFTIGLMWVVCLALRPTRVTLFRCAGIVAFAIALCAFWILPTLLAGGAVRTVVQTSPVSTALATFAQFSDPRMTATLLAFPGYFYFNALGGGAALFFAGYALLVVLWGYALIVRRTALLVVLAILFVVVAVVPLGGNPVIGPAILAVFTALLPYSLFLRTPQHVMFIMSLIVPMLTYLSLRVVPRRFFAVSVAVGALVFLAYGQGWFVNSNLLGLIGPFGETAGERATVSAAARASGSGEQRTLFVPSSESYYYHPGIFDYYFEGGDEPQIRLFPGITQGSGSKWTPYARTQQLLKALDELVPDGAGAQTQSMLLQLAAIKSIVVHTIGVPAAGVRLHAQNDRPYLESALRRSAIAVPTARFDDRSLWRFKRPVPRFYAPDCVFGVSPRASIYDVLALAPAAAGCAKPAAIASSAPEVWSAAVLSPAEFESPATNRLPISLFKSNVETNADADGTGFLATVPAGVQDVQIFRIPRVVKNATGVGLRMYSSADRRVYMQLLAPDDKNYFEATVDLRVLDVGLNFNDFGVVGNPSKSNIRYLRLASTNSTQRDVEMYSGNVHWLFAAAGSSSVPPYLGISGNRFDRYYYGGDRLHLLLVPLSINVPAYATFPINNAGLYDVVAHVQDEKRVLSLQAAVDGHWGSCSRSGADVDLSERLVRLMRLRLPAGAHALALRFCDLPAPGDQPMGVQSVIVASARLQPPAVQTIGAVHVVHQRPGTIRLQAFDNYLIFTDSYDDRWTATQKGRTLQHVVANGYANGWIVPNLGAGDVVLTFWPQRSFVVGIAVSLALGFFCVVTIAVLLTSGRRRATSSAKATRVALERPA